MKHTKTNFKEAVQVLSMLVITLVFCYGMAQLNNTKKEYNCLFNSFLEYRQSTTEIINRYSQFVDSLQRENTKIRLQNTKK